MRWTRKLGQLSVTVERTTCIVRASKTRDVLINAANEALAGAQLPYFPRGGPCPPPLPKGIDNANSWGALETGPGFVFREHAVDGVVSSLGGKALRDLCARARPDDFGAGSAVATAAPGLPFRPSCTQSRRSGSPRRGAWTCSAPTRRRLRSRRAGMWRRRCLARGRGAHPSPTRPPPPQKRSPPRRRHRARHGACPSASSTTWP